MSESPSSHRSLLDVREPFPVLEEHGRIRVLVRLPVFRPGPEVARRRVVLGDRVVHPVVQLKYEP